MKDLQKKLEEDFFQFFLIPLSSGLLLNLFLAVSFGQAFFPTDWVFPENVPRSIGVQVSKINFLILFFVLFFSCFFFVCVFFFYFLFFTFYYFLLRHLIIKKILWSSFFLLLSANIKITLITNFFIYSSLFTFLFFYFFRCFFCRL